MDSCPANRFPPDFNRNGSVISLVLLFACTDLRIVVIDLPCHLTTPAIQAGLSFFCCPLLASKPRHQFHRRRIVSPICGTRRERVRVARSDPEISFAEPTWVS